MADKKTLAQKLAEVMLVVQYIQKRGKNTFHGYTYATEADVNDRFREELAKRNVIMLPSLKSHTLRETVTAKGQTEYIVCVDMEFTFVDADSGETYTIQMSGEGQDRGDKAIYKAISGAQKYALMKLFMVPTGDDPEADSSVDERNHGKSTGDSQGQNIKPATKAQIASIQTAKKAVGMTRDQLAQLAQQVGADLDNLTYEAADKLIAALAEYKPQAQEVAH